MKYLEGTIFAKFYSDNLIDVWFVYCKEKESDGISKFVELELGVVVIAHFLPNRIVWLTSHTKFAWNWWSNSWDMGLNLVGALSTSYANHPYLKFIHKPSAHVKHI